MALFDAVRGHVPAALLLAFVALSGCAKPAVYGNLKVRALATNAEPPANVAVYVGVTDEGEPLTDLDASAFRVYENDTLVSPDEAKTTILPRELVTSEHVVLLIDLSGQLSDEQRSTYARAVEAFVRKLQTTLPVTVLAFSGSEKPKKVGEYARAANTLDPGQPNAIKLAKLVPPDPSRDLNGAIVAGLAELDERLGAEGKPVELGTLVVFARGPDLAGRVSAAELDETLAQSQAGIIGIGVEPETPYLDFAQNGVFRAGNPEEIPNAVPIAFEEAASRIMKVYRRYYLVQYCSPSRSGKTRSRLEIVYKGEDGKERRGDASFDFEAGTFASGCNPETPPKFSRESPAGAAEQ
jgi:hypothetical protein